MFTLLLILILACFVLFIANSEYMPHAIFFSVVILIASITGFTFYGANFVGIPFNIFLAIIAYFVGSALILAPIEKQISTIEELNESELYKCSNTSMDDNSKELNKKTRKRLDALQVKLSNEANILSLGLLLIVGSVFILPWYLPVISFVLFILYGSYRLVRYSKFVN